MPTAAVLWTAYSEVRLEGPGGCLEGHHTRVSLVDRVGPVTVGADCDTLDTGVGADVDGTDHRPVRGRDDIDPALSTAPDVQHRPRWSRCHLVWLGPDGDPLE
ncbi:MAG: hypothetical protein J07HX64_02289 [halophilic archaeon J07HX64]|nr:MAG: hypothetical protein J07HX64_02289 [halophilic archaeon J07HX64]